MTAEAWRGVRGLNVHLAARGLGVVPPLTVLAAAAMLVGDDDIRWADVSTDAAGGTARWTVVVLTPTHLVTVEASSPVAGWSYDNPGPDAEHTAAADVSATVRRLSDVTAVAAPGCPVRLAWPGGEVTVPLSAGRGPRVARRRRAFGCGQPRTNARTDPARPR